MAEILQRSIADHSGSRTEAAITAAAWRSHPVRSMPATAESLNQLTSVVVQAAIRVHRALGPGLLESAYLGCLCYELSLSGVAFETQKALPLVYQGMKIDCAYRVDLVVAKSVIVEVKALEFLAPIHSRQLYTYLRVADCRVGLILNFGAPTMKEGIKRVVNDLPE
jgi:GxxExxY protein